jgi:uncharacterized membrane protein required for colicin V production
MLAAQNAGTLEQFSADAILVVVVVVNAWMGWRTGTLRRLLAFAGLYVGVLAAYYTGNSFAAVFRRGDIFANGWSFIAVATVVVLICEVFGRVLGDQISRLATFTFDRFAGMLIGGAVGFFQVGLLFMVALAVAAAPASGNAVPVTRDLPANAIRSAPLSSQAVRAQPLVRAIFSPAFANDLTVHLRDSTQLVTVGP